VADHPVTTGRHDDRRQPCQPVPDQPGKDSQMMSSRCRDWL
jgi:hypothetical protein